MVYCLLSSASLFIRVVYPVMVHSYFTLIAENPAWTRHHRWSAHSSSTLLCKDLLIPVTGPCNLFILFNFPLVSMPKNQRFLNIEPISFAEDAFTEVVEVLWNSRWRKENTTRYLANLLRWSYNWNSWIQYL